MPTSRLRAAGSLSSGSPRAISAVSGPLRIVRQGSSNRWSVRLCVPAIPSAAGPAWRTWRLWVSSGRASASSSSGAPFAGLRQHDRVNLAEKVREIPDWPQPGVGFKDITPLLADPAALAYTVEQLSTWGAEKKPDLVLGAEARGFILGAAIAKEIGCGFVPARRPGKLPPETISA